MFDKAGNQVFMQGANGEMVKSISMGNSNRAEGANQAIRNRENTCFKQI